MLTLKIVSLNKSASSVECDSIHLCVPDDGEGEGGGSYGIRPGHIKSLISLDIGKITAFLKGKEVFSCNTDGGFATVEDDIVTVVTQRIKNVE